MRNMLVTIYKQRAQFLAVLDIQKVSGDAIGDKFPIYHLGLG